MDGSRFDDLVRNLSRKRVSRLDAMRGLAAAAAAAVAGVALFSHDSEAVNNGKGPKSNPKRKKKTICHCATFDPASCTTIKPRPKSAKKHLKHQCDYAGPCVAGKVGCPVPSGGGPQPSQKCSAANPCPAATPCCDSSGACKAPACGSICTLESGQHCCDNEICDTPCDSEGHCPPPVCTEDRCSKNSDCNGGAKDCACRNIIHDEGTCGTEEECSALECREDADCNGAFNDCHCRNKNSNGDGTCGTVDICNADRCYGDDDCNGDAKDCTCRDFDEYAGYGTCGTEDQCPANQCEGDYDCNTNVTKCKCRDIYDGYGTCGVRDE